MTETSATTLNSDQAQLQQRVDELSVLYKLSMLMATQRDLQQVLDAAARSVAEVMKVKAASIRLLSDNGRELVIKAVHNLSDQYLNKGPLLVEEAAISQRALAGEVVYIEDMRHDPRIVYPDEADREGLVSSLVVGMIYQHKPIGTIRAYTGEKCAFTQSDIDLIRAVAQLLAAAITNARLNEEHRQALHVKEQLRLAGDVQRRMLPAAVPQLPGFDIAAQYIPTLDLGGDFYDYIKLNNHVGIALGDVVGKGVAASLLMASVRASLRAYAQDLYDINQVIARVNVALTRDTLDNEFATLFYGVLDPTRRRFTYCNAGHNPPILLRHDQITELDVGGLIVGIDAQQVYDSAIVHLQTDDVLLIYSDGLSEARNFENEQFSKHRIIDAMKSARTLPECAQACRAAAMLKHILWQMRCFTGLQHNSDDTTAVLIHVTG